MEIKLNVIAEDIFQELKMYNKTQLSPDVEFERHIFHRDQFAHYLRWTHVLKSAKINQNILDIGCGTGNLLEVLYRNRYNPLNYLGLDVRKSSLLKAKEKFIKLKYADFECVDLCKEYDFNHVPWDLICSFEVIEHIGKQNGDKFLYNITKHMNKKTLFLLSTPVFDESVGAAKNHIINGEICEYSFDELKHLLEKYFIIEDVFGTFASQRDYKPIMNEWQKEMFKELTKYYDSNLISNIMAPFFPEHSRNCLWRCRSR